MVCALRSAGTPERFVVQSVSIHKPTPDTVGIVAWLVPQVPAAKVESAHVPLVSRSAVTSASTKQTMSTTAVIARVFVCLGPHADRALVIAHLPTKRCVRKDAQMFEQTRKTAVIAMELVLRMRFVPTRSVFWHPM